MKLLVIATHLPPYIGSANIRLLNYINYLNKLGHEIDVITVKYPTDYKYYDKKMENVFEKTVNIYRENPGILFNLAYTKENYVKKSNFNYTFKNRVLLKVKKFIKSNFFILDHYLMWISNAYKRSLSLLNEKEYDYMLSFHESPCSHVVAYKIKKEFPSLKWIGYWSDPWVDDSLSNNNRIKKAIENNIEKKLVNSMDKLLFTSQDTAQMYINKYKLDSNKINLVYRGYSTDLYNKIMKMEFRPNEYEKNKINFVHTGTIYKKLRDIYPLYTALNKLSQTELNKKIHFYFIGKFDSQIDETLLGNLNNVTIYPHMSYEESLSYMLHSDVLLLFGNKNSTQIPGKVYEYLGSKSIILTLLGDSNDPLNNISFLHKKGKVIINNETEIYNTIIDLVNNFENYKKVYEKPIEDFEWNNVAKDLERKIKSC